MVGLLADHAKDFVRNAGCDAEPEEHKTELKNGREFGGSGGGVFVNQFSGGVLDGINNARDDITDRTKDGFYNLSQTLLLSFLAKMHHRLRGQ